jgi:flagellar biosynthesis protein FliR
MAGIALALVSKAAPAFPFTALALPIRSMLGLILVAIGLATLVGSLVNAWQHWMIAPL